jgi:hypothetical protein
MMGITPVIAWARSLWDGDFPLSLLRLNDFLKKSEVTIMNIFTRVTATVVGFVAMMAGTAHAALPAAIGTELAAVQADGLALVDLVWPVVITLFGAALLIKLFKRFAVKI